MLPKKSYIMWESSSKIFPCISPSSLLCVYKLVWGWGSRDPTLHLNIYFHYTQVLFYGFLEQTNPNFHKIYSLRPLKGIFIWQKANESLPFYQSKLCQSTQLFWAIVVCNPEVRSYSQVCCMPFFIPWENTVLPFFLIFVQSKFPLDS